MACYARNREETGGCPLPSAVTGCPGTMLCQVQSGEVLDDSMEITAMSNDVVAPRTVFRWQRLDAPGLEILSLNRTGDGISIHGQCIDAGDDPFCVHHEWSLDTAWRSRSMRLTLTHAAQDRHLQIERIDEARWRIDGSARPDLDGCEELDLSFTPICNGIALRRQDLAIGESFELTALYVRPPELFIAPSRQKYLRTAANSYRYIDLGVAAGFEAALQVDAERMITHYEGLFERV